MSLVHVYSASDHTDAQLLLGFLTSEGLHPTIPGEELSDEIASSQRMSGTLGSNVYVPEAEAERAREMVAAWKEKAGE